MDTANIPSRSEIPKDETWNDEAVFKNRAHWNRDFEALKKDLERIEGFKGSLSQSPLRLVKWFEVLSEIYRKSDKLEFYAYMAMSVDGNDTEATALVGQIEGLSAKIRAKTAFANPEILAMDPKILLNWIKNEKILFPFKHTLENLSRSKPHIRSGEVEEVLGIVSEPFNSVEMTYKLLSSIDTKFPNTSTKKGTSIEITQSNIEEIKKHPNRVIRKSGMENYADTYLNLKHTYGANYLAAAKQSLSLSRIRGYKSVLEYKLAPYNIPTDVFHNLINTFKKNIPIWHRYWDVKRRLLKLDVMRPYDIWAPLTERQPSNSFNDAVSLICKGMEPLGHEYVNTMKRGCLEERWVDHGRNKGKSQGAFSYGTYDTAPCIMLSYDGSLSELSSLAHELGHSMHSYLTNKNQSYFDSQYSMFAAEVASNFNQAMVRDSLLKSNHDREFQLAVIQEAMDNIHRYFFIMPTLARFEYEIYKKLEQGEAVNTGILQETMKNLFAQGYGETLKDDSERSSITWATFGHLYEPFYTFQYATGISAAHALCSGILAKKKNSVENYLQFLSLGNSEYPLKALSVAGVDMLSTAPVEAGFKILESLIKRLEDLI